MLSSGLRSVPGEVPLDESVSLLSDGSRLLADSTLMTHMVRSDASWAASSKLVSADGMSWKSLELLLDLLRVHELLWTALELFSAGGNWNTFRRCCLLLFGGEENTP